MDAIVTARVPVEIKEQGAAILREIGATPTQLVNAAYEYLLAKGELPPSRTGTMPAPGRRTLTPEQKESVRILLDAMYVGPLKDTRPYKEILNEAREERYAAFL